jgi:DNA-binding CsgD family transcriptional regulator
VGSVQARRGESGGRELLDAGVASADAADEAEWVILAHLARAEAKWLDGDDAGARADVGVAVAVAENTDRWGRGAVLVWSARLGVPTGSAANIPEPYRLMLAGDARAAAERWLQLDSPVDAAYAIYDGDTDDTLRDSLRLFDELGAKAVARRVRARMKELGIRTIPIGARAATRANSAGLTPREVEVLEQVSLGHTNAEIAGELFISEKTVDHHVSSILGKLGASTRRAAAITATQRGLLRAGVE